MRCSDVSITSAGKLPKRCRVKGRVLCADKTKRKLYYVVNGRTARTLQLWPRPGGDRVVVYRS